MELIAPNQVVELLSKITDSTIEEVDDNLNEDGLYYGVVQLKAKPNFENIYKLDKEKDYIFEFSIKDFTLKIFDSNYDSKELVKEQYSLIKK